MASKHLRADVVRQAAYMIGARIAVAAAAAAIGAVAWTRLADGLFQQRFGALLAIAGVLMAMPPSGAFTRAGTVDANMWLGRGPDAPYRDLDGRPGLTRFGIFLFISIPLIAVGTWLT